MIILLSALLAGYLLGGKMGMIIAILLCMVCMIAALADE